MYVLHHSSTTKHHRWLRFPWKEYMYPHDVNIMTGDDLATVGSRAPTVIILPEMIWAQPYWRDGFQMDLNPRLTSYSSYFAQKIII